MARRQFQEPEKASRLFGCGVATVLVGVPFVPLAWWPGREWLALLALPGGLCILLWLYGKHLLRRARRSGITAVVLTSNSPIWQAYIEQQWLPRMGAQAAVANWSERKKWDTSLAVELLKFYVGFSKDYCPAVLVLRGLDYPIVFRYYRAFHDLKHGRPDALRRLERQMGAALGWQDPPPAANE